MVTRICRSASLMGKGLWNSLKGIGSMDHEAEQELCLLLKQDVIKKFAEGLVTDNGEKTSKPLESGGVSVERVYVVDSTCMDMYDGELLRIEAFSWMGSKLYNTGAPRSRL